MKFKKHLIHYVDKRISTVFQILEIKPVNWKPETFHRLRLEIKKLNAVSGLLNFCIKDFHRKKIFSPFKIIFKGAGAVRDIQIENNFLIKNKTLLFSNRVQGRIIKKRKKRFFELLDKRLLHDMKVSRKMIKEEISKLNKNDVNEYFENRIAEVEELLRKKLSAKQLHKLRTRLKKIFFNLKSILIQRRLPYTILNRYLDLLGRWNDKRITLKQIAHMIHDNKLSGAQRKKISMIRTGLVAQSGQLRKMISERNKKMAPLIHRLARESKGGFLGA